jgi:hypothetical protein
MSDTSALVWVLVSTVLGWNLPEYYFLSPLEKNSVMIATSGKCHDIECQESYDLKFKTFYVYN